jgi:glycosyltransferase involved in cell wall biosynthesis
MFIFIEDADKIVPEYPDLAVVSIIPAFNEEISIGSMVHLTKRYVQRVIVVDDGSQDRTAEVAESAGAEVIRHEKNQGKGAALRTGFLTVHDADIIITIDADGQHDFADIPRLLAPILEGRAEMVNGSRYLEGRKGDTPLYRRLGQIVLDRASNLDSGLGLTDTQSGFRAFAASAVPVFRFSEKGLAIESEMLADAARAKLGITEVEIGVRYDVGCSKENPLVHGLRVLMSIFQDMEMNKLNKPLLCFTLPGLAMTCAGFFMYLLFFQNVCQGENFLFGPTILMILLTFVGGSMTSIGIILYILGRR